MSEESILHSYSARVLDTFSETVIPVVPEFVWDSWLRILRVSKDLSEADPQYQILVFLLIWLLVNLILIRVAWGIFGADNIKLLSSTKGKVYLDRIPYVNLTIII